MLQHVRPSFALYGWVLQAHVGCCSHRRTVWRLRSSCLEEGSDRAKPSLSLNPLRPIYPDCGLRPRRYQRLKACWNTHRTPNTISPTSDFFNFSAADQVTALTARHHVSKRASSRNSGCIRFFPARTRCSSVTSHSKSGPGCQTDCRCPSKHLLCPEAQLVQSAAKPANGPLTNGSYIALTGAGTPTTATSSTALRAPFRHSPS